MSKLVRDGNKIMEDAEFNKRIGYYEEALEDSIVVKKALLKKIVKDWNKRTGEVRLAKFLLGGTDDEGNKDFWLQKALVELEAES